MTITMANTITPAWGAAHAVRLLAVAPARWRVIDHRGRAIGHLEQAEGAAGRHYRARRFHSASGSFRDLGDFFSPDDALECLRFS